MTLEKRIEKLEQAHPAEDTYSVDLANCVYMVGDRTMNEVQYLEWLAGLPPGNCVVILFHDSPPVLLGKNDFLATLTNGVNMISIPFNGRIEGMADPPMPARDKNRRRDLFNTTFLGAGKSYKTRPGSCF
jgi:hypothetical protein